MKILKIPKAVWVTVSAWIGRLSSAVVQLISIPMSLAYLGPDQYAWLVVAVSIQGWLLLSDGGMSLALQNSISESRAKGCKYDDLVRAVAKLVACIATTIFILVLCMRTEFSAFLLPRNAVLNGASNSLIICATLFGLMMTCGNVAYRVFYAEHRGYWVNILPAIGSCLTLIGLIFVTKILPVAPNITVAAIIWMGPTAILAFFAFVKIYLRSKIVIRDQSEIKLRSIFYRAIPLGIFALLGAFTQQIDYVVIGKLMSESEIVLYSIANKMITFTGFFFVAIIYASWPVCAEATAVRNWKSADSVLKQTIIIGMLIVLIGAISIWLVREALLGALAPNQSISLPLPLWVLLTIYCLIRGWSDSFVMILQGMGHSRVFWIYLPIQSVISIAGQFFLGARLGLNGIVIAEILAFALTSAWMLPLRYRAIKLDKL